MEEVLRNVGHSMRMVLDTKKSNVANQLCLRFHIWFIMTLYYKVGQTLLQNATAITKCDVYHKMRRYSQQYGFFLESDINVLPSFQATGLTGIKFLLS